MALSLALILPALSLTAQVNQTFADGVQQLSCQMQEMQRQYSQALAYFEQSSARNTLLAHQMSQMRDIQLGSIGMLTEMYRRQMQSGGDHGIGSSLAPLPPALASSHLALPKQSSATLDLALPKAVQDRIRKQHKLREKRHQQDQEEVKAKRQAVQNRMPCPCNSAAKSASVDAAPEDTLPGDAELPNVPQSDSAEPVGLETSTSNQHLPVPGRDMLAWTEWLGKRVGISGQKLPCTTIAQVAGMRTDSSSATVSGLAEPPMSINAFVDAERCLVGTYHW